MRRVWAAYSGVKVWATDRDANYPNSANAALYSPVIALPPHSNPVLEFQHWFVSETTFDRGRVELSTDGWATMDYLDQFTGSLGGYTLMSYDLSLWAGQEIQIRFWFTSDFSQTYPGWYIDDFAVRDAGASIEFH